MAEQSGNTVDNGQPEAQSALGLDRAIWEPVELLKHGLLITRCDPDTRIQHLNRNHAPISATTDQDSARARVASRVADKILQNTAQQRRVRTNRQVRFREPQPQPLLPECLCELRFERKEQGSDVKILGFGLGCRRIQPGYVEQRAQQVLNAQQPALHTCDQLALFSRHLAPMLIEQRRKQLGRV